MKTKQPLKTLLLLFCLRHSLGKPIESEVPKAPAAVVCCAKFAFKEVFLPPSSQNKRSVSPAWPNNFTTLQCKPTPSSPSAGDYWVTELWPYHTNPVSWILAPQPLNSVVVWTSWAAGFNIFGCWKQGKFLASPRHFLDLLFLFDFHFP